MRQLAQISCFVPPLVLPACHSTPTFVSITSRPPQRLHCSISAGFGIARTRFLTCSAGVACAGVPGMTWSFTPPMLLPPA